ncbi:MAG: hypothetical protein K2O34_02495 [Acetatifactor sp.]|nr:hypothetical protein [Acetatifactor sp.]
MFKLFGKKGSLEEQLEECRHKKDWAGMAKICYQLGVAAMEQGELEKAQLWLGRADTIYSADDRIYKKVGEKLMDDCSKRMGQLEDASMLLYNSIPARVEEAAENLKDVQVRVWGLLSLARLVKLGRRLAVLPGCEMFGKLEWAVDTVLKSLQKPPAEEEFNGLRELSGELYRLSDASLWGAESEIEVPGGAPFQVFDLNGMTGVLLETDMYLDAHLEMVCALSRGEEPPSPETGMIAVTLLPDYYVRTGAGKLEEVPQIKAELERIWSDHQFVCSPDMTWELVEQKVEEYKKLDILAV